MQHDRNNLNSSETKENEAVEAAHHVHFDY